MTNFLKQCLFNWPAIGENPRVKSLAIYLKRICPFHEVLSFSTISYLHIRTTIVGLFAHGRPTTILRSIAFAIVNPIYRMTLGRLWPHVSQKNLKVIPTFTYADPSPVISGRILVPGPTACSHPHPDAVFRYFAVSKLSFLFFHIISKLRLTIKITRTTTISQSGKSL